MAGQGSGKSRTVKWVGFGVCRSPIWRGDAQAEATEAYDVEGHPNDPAADAGRTVGPRELGVARAEQDVGCDISVAGSGNGTEPAAGGGPGDDEAATHRQFFQARTAT